MIPLKLPAYTDLILLEPTVTIDHIEQLCKAARSNNVSAICVPPLFVKKAKAFLVNTPVKITTVIGYPYGYNAIEAKLAEVILAMVDGCDELEVYINLTALKNEDWQYLARELSAIAPVIQKQGRAVTVVVEQDFLNDDELVKCCDLYGVAGVNQFYLISTGTGIAVLQNRIRTLRTQLADAVKIKVTVQGCGEEDLLKLVDAGADRIGLPFTVK